MSQDPVSSHHEQFPYPEGIVYMAHNMDRHLSVNLMSCSELNSDPYYFFAYLCDELSIDPKIRFFAAEAAPTQGT